MNIHTFEAARVTIRDVDLLIVFLEANLHSNTTSEQRSQLYDRLANCAKSAGLAGEVVALWPDEFGRTRFIAPPQQHRFFQVVNYDQLYAQRNCTLNCEPWPSRLNTPNEGIPSR